MKLKPGITAAIVAGAASWLAAVFILGGPVVGVLMLVVYIIGSVFIPLMIDHFDRADEWAAIERELDEWDVDKA